MPLYLGIDLGTSGVRASVIDDAGDCVASTSTKLAAPLRLDDRPCQDANLWWQATGDCLNQLASRLQAIGCKISDIAALSVDGTSGTLLLADQNLRPVTLGYLYNSANFDREAATISAHAPADSLARGSASTLARLLFLQSQPEAKHACYALHQADWIASKLMGRGGYSDETNVLKLGFDVQHRQWPSWFSACGVNTDLLPEVRPVGNEFGEVSDASADTFGFAKQTKVIAGTTDSNAAFLASGASRIGDGVTSLGTTLAIKLLSDKPVVDRSRGVYSHRIKEMWLPGGASNSGGGVLLDYFTKEQMSELEKEIVPANPTGLGYYPLSRPGERFPISDPALAPRATPRPESDVKFFQGLLEGISEIERIGYSVLQELGAPKLQRVLTAGGGAKNEAWTRIRAAKLGVPVLKAASGEASVGAARIAAQLI